MLTWPPPGYGEDGYVDEVDVVYAVIVNSIVEKVNTVVAGSGSAYSDYVSGYRVAHGGSTAGVLDLYEWLDSLKGTDGTPGASGSPGTPGASGTPGRDGTNGLNGSNGTDGVGMEALAVGAPIPSSFPANTIILRYSSA